MLIFSLIDVQYSQKAAFSFEKGLDRQNHFASCSLYLVKKIPSPRPPPRQVKFSIPLNPLRLFGRSQYIKLFGHFLWMGCNCLKAIQSLYEETVYFLPEIPGIHEINLGRMKDSDDLEAIQ